METTNAASVVDELADVLADTSARLSKLIEPSAEIVAGSLAADRILNDGTSVVGSLRAIAKKDRTDAELWKRAVAALDSALAALDTAHQSAPRLTERPELEAVQALRADIAAWRDNADAVAATTVGMADALEAFAEEAWRSYEAAIASTSSTVMPGGALRRWTRVLGETSDAARAEARALRKRAGS